MTDVTTLPNAGAGDLAAGYMYMWVPGAPASQFKVPITELAALGLATASWKAPVRAASTANGTLASAFENGDSLDGVTLATGDRILLKNQTAAAENGIYTVNASGAPSRALDANAGSELVNAAVAVSEGAVNADKIFSCVTNAPITLGTTGLTFAEVGARQPPAIQSVTSSATVTPTFSDDQVNITAQAAGLTLANPTGTAVDGWGLSIRIKDNGTTRTISYGTQYRALGITLPAATAPNKTLYLGLIFNLADTKWDVVAVAQEA